MIRSRSPSTTSRTAASRRSSIPCRSCATRSAMTADSDTPQFGIPASSASTRGSRTRNCWPRSTGTCATSRVRASSPSWKRSGSAPANELKARVSSRFDLVVRGGTLVIPGVGSVAADIGISDTRIAAIGAGLAGEAADVLDASGKAVLPGLFDPHVHIGNELSFEEEAQSETRAAILGGVTSIGVMVRSLEDSYFLYLPAFRRAMDERSYVDSIFHLQIFTDQQIAEMPDYARQYGVRSFKFYMSGIPGIVNSVTDDVLFTGFKQVASIGADVVAC